jgi:hypothetical protein
MGHWQAYLKILQLDTGNVSTEFYVLTKLY